MTLTKTTKSLLSCRTLLQKSLYLGVLRDPKARLDTIQNLSHWRSCSESTFEWVLARVHFDRTDSRSFLHFQAVFEQFPSALILTPFLKWGPRHGAELTRPCRPDILEWFHDAAERHLGGSLKVPITFFSDSLSGPNFYRIDNILCSLFWKSLTSIGCPGKKKQKNLPRILIIERRPRYFKFWSESSIKMRNLSTHSWIIALLVSPGAFKLFKKAWENCKQNSHWKLSWYDLAWIKVLMHSYRSDIAEVELIKFFRGSSNFLPSRGS